MPERTTYPAREARKAKGLTLAQVGKQLHLTPAYIGGLERRGCPCHRTARRLSAFYECPMEYFLPQPTPGGRIVREVTAAGGGVRKPRPQSGKKAGTDADPEKVKEKRVYPPEKPGSAWG